jgi:hypothetical protein
MTGIDACADLSSLAADFETASIPGGTKVSHNQQQAVAVPALPAPVAELCT